MQVHVSRSGHRPPSPRRDATSPGSGKRPVSCFENTFRPSATTSKTPPEPLTNFTRAPNARSSSSARPAALG